MDKYKQWFDFIQSAHILLLKGQSFDENQPHIQFLIEPAFSNSVHLQLVVHDQDVQWFRTTWQRHIDEPKFWDIIENLQYIGQVASPTMQYESGRVEQGSVAQLFEIAQTISVKPQLEKSSQIILDGESNTLIISNGTTHSTFVWKVLPSEWKELGRLTNLLTTLNDSLE